MTQPSIEVIYGEIPKNCNCTIFRTSPRFDVENIKNFRLPAFDGYGQIHKFSFSGGSVKYQHNFVKTRRYLHEVEAGKSPIFPMLSWKNSISRIKILQSLLKYKTIAICANTNVIPFGQHLYAFYDGCMPHYLCPDTLETYGMVNIPGYHSVLAHPKLSSCGSKMLAVTRNLWKPNKIFLCELDRQINLLREMPISVKKFQFLHDFFVVGRYTVLFLSPLKMFFSFKKFFAKTALLDWEDTKEATIICVIDNAEWRIVKTVEVQTSLFLTHVAGGKITQIENSQNLEIFGIFYEDSPELFKLLAAQNSSDFDYSAKGKLYSFSIELDNAQNNIVSWEKVWSGNCAVCAETQLLSSVYCILSTCNSVALLNIEKFHVSEIEYENEALTFEASFDNIYVYVFYNQGNCSYIDIYLKEEFRKADLCCTLKLPEYVPLFFHGSTIQNDPIYL